MLEYAIVIGILVLVISTPFIIKSLGELAIIKKLNVEKEVETVVKYAINKVEAEAKKQLKKTGQKFTSEEKLEKAIAFIKENSPIVEKTEKIAARVETALTNVDGVARFDKLIDKAALDLTKKS